MFDDVDRARDQEWVATPDVDIAFVRWIENPKNSALDLEGLVAGDSIDVPAERVRNLPLLVGAGLPDQ